jgi:hypothetical protein
MCHHFRLRFSQDMHTHRVSENASDSIFMKACLFSNFVKSYLSISRYHVRDVVAGDCIDANQIGDLEVLVHGTAD